MPIAIPKVRQQIPEYINNKYASMLYNMCRMLFTEVCSCDSVNSSTGLSPADTARLLSNISAVEQRVAHIEEELKVPQDEPEFKKDYPVIPLEDDPPLSDNLDTVSILDLIQSAALQAVTAGQTVKTSVWYHPMDLLRFKNSIGALKRYVENYLPNATPLDITQITSRAATVYPPGNVITSPES